MYTFLDKINYPSDLKKLEKKGAGAGLTDNDWRRV